MNKLIKQLQQSLKWREFEEWYDNFNGTKDARDEQVYWEDLSIRKFKVLQFPFQKGVFEKFIESQGYQLEQNSDGNIMKYTIWTEENGFEYQKNLEKLLIWYFNN